MFFVHLNTKIHHTNSKLQVNMKKIIFIMLLGLVCNTINAQIVTKQELEEYTNIGDMSWSAKAKELSNEYKLNELGELSLSIIKEYKGQSKSQLYRKIIDWVISMSSDAKSAIQVSNEEEGTIIARCYLPNIAKRTMGDNSYRVSIRPLIKFDFKEERIRMTYTLQNYEVLKINDDSGYVIMFGGGFGVTEGTVVTDVMNNWDPDSSNSTVQEITSNAAVSGGKALVTSSITGYVGAASNFAVTDGAGGLMPTYTYGFGEAVKTFFGWLDDAMVYIWE